MQPFKLITSNLLDMDFFLARGNDFWGDIISFGEKKGNKAATHGGFITQDHNNFFATEMNPKLKEDSLDAYTGSKVQIIKIYRYMKWDPQQKEAASTFLASLRAQLDASQTHYDILGAIMSSPRERLSLAGYHS